ncbi:MAG: hypothetical protein L7G92_02085, partial [Stygiolobus sp.]|nr:hypothetical protein [Stygiolobus sp.]
MAKPKKGAKESRLVYVPFVIAVVIVALVVVLAFVKPPATNTAQNGGSFPLPSVRQGLEPGLRVVAQ